MGGLVAVDAKRVQLRDDDPGDRTAESWRPVEQVVQVGLALAWESRAVVDEEDDLLGKRPQLDGGTRGVDVRVHLGQGAELGELFPSSVAGIQSSEIS